MTTASLHGKLAVDEVGTKIVKTMEKVFPSDPTREVEKLKKELQDLQARNAQLQDLLVASQNQAIIISGQLYKYRNHPLGLFSHEWEPRYIVLVGTTLKYYKTEKDSVFLPRGEVDVTECYVEYEGLKKSRFHTFGVVDPEGLSVARLSTENKQLAEKWMTALEGVGCKRKVVNVLARTKSPLPDRRSRQVPAREAVPFSSHLGGSPDTRLQDRWEASSTDSELPERPREMRRASVLLEGHDAISQASGESDSDTSLPRAQAPLSPRGPPAAPAHVGSPPHGRSPMTGSTPVHTISRFSYLSSDTMWVAKHDGLLNLGMVILVAANFRLVIENLLKYGIRLNFLRYVNRALHGKGNLPLVLCFPALLLFSLMALAIEHMALQLLDQEMKNKEVLVKKDASSKTVLRVLSMKRKRTEWTVGIMNVINTSICLLLPCYVISWNEAEPIPAFLLTFCTIIVWMKLVSYAHCHWDIRVARREGKLRAGEKGSPESVKYDWVVQKYPNNLTLRNLLWYLAIPTLTYQVNYPRSKRLRKRWLVRRCMELVFFSGLLLFIVDQYIVPAVDNSLKPLAEMNLPRLLERILKLAIPNLYAWLTGFYCLFHLWLNILAELTRFGDREFYKDWWNAATIGDYWKLWNMPVHKWLLRTVYFPALRCRLSRFPAMLLVFFVSAVMHEVMMGVPLRMVRFWAFSGMLLQVPLVVITENLKTKVKSDTWGNYIFWTTFCMFGQPVALLSYWHDYVFAQRVVHQVSFTPVE